MSKGNSGGGAAVGGGGGGAAVGNAAQRAHPNLAHLLNGSKVGTYTRTRKQAENEVKSIRQKGGTASLIRDPQGQGDRNYLVVVPDR